MDTSRWFVFSAIKLRRKYIRAYEKDQQDAGLTATEGLMLKVISLHDGLTVTELGEKMQCNKSLITRNMKSITDMGYTETSAVDGRTVCIKLTPKGRDIVDKANINGNIFVDRVFEKCTPEEREKFFEILAKLDLD